MKKLLVNLHFLSLTTLSLAQTPFTEQTVRDMTQRMLKDYPKFVQEEVSPDFFVIFGEGQVASYDNMKASNNSNIVTWDLSELKVKQIGNMAVVTGINKHSIGPSKTKATDYYNVRFTYTYAFIKDKWLWLQAQHTHILAPQASEVEAIKKVLVDERKAFYAGDKDIEKYWKDDPKTLILTSYPSGRYSVLDNERRKSLVSQFKAGGNGHVGTITSSKVQVYGKIAVANVEMTINYKNGSEAKERHLINLEKNGENWQITNYSLHGVPKDAKEDSAAIVKVIEKETQSWHNRDAEGRISCIANVPYGLVLVHHGNMANNNGVAYGTNEKLNAPEALKAQTASMGKPNGSTFKNENYVVTIKGGTAFASYDEITTASDGIKQYSHSVRNLEKIDGLWKLTYIGGVFYKP